MDSVLKGLLEKYGFDDYKQVSGDDIVVRNWVRFKCRYMCGGYGERAICPPNTPPVDECEAFFKEYRSILIIRFTKKAHPRSKDSEVFKTIDQSLLDLEKELFYKGYYKVMVMPPTICHWCETCVPTRAQCRHKEAARPTPEAFAVDVFETVHRIGYPLEVLPDYDATMNRYAFLLLR